MAHKNASLFVSVKNIKLLTRSGNSSPLHFGRGVHAEQLMKLTQLNAFKAVVECQTVTAAAERLNLSQPAVSRLISGLEQRIGFQLFIRKGNRLELSDEGQAFYLEVAKVFDAVSGLSQSASSIRSRHFGV